MPWELLQNPHAPWPVDPICARDTVLDLRQRFGAIEAPRIAGSASASLPIGCAETFVMLLPHIYNQAARDILA